MFFVVGSTNTHVYLQLLLHVGALVHAVLNMLSANSHMTFVDETLPT